MGDDDISEAALGVALVDSELLHRVLVQIPFRLEAALTDRDRGIRRVVQGQHDLGTAL